MGDEVKVDLFLRKATGLVKEIGPAGAFVLPWSSMAGSGITLYAMSVIYSYPTGSVPLAFLIVGVPTILSAATIALMMMCAPRSAGGYVWGTRFLDPFLGWFGAGWVYWLVQVFSIALIGAVIGAVYPVIFVTMGTATKWTALYNFGVTLASSQFLQAATTVVTIVVLGLLCLIEIKHYMKILITIWSLNTIGMVVSMALFLVNNASTIPGNWDSLWGAGSYETITALALKYNLAGYVASTTTGFWGDTLAIIAYIFWALTGYEAVAYVAGEVRNPRASFLYFFMAGMVSTVAWYTAITAAAYNSYGDFVLKYNYVYNLLIAGKLSGADAASVSYMQLPSMPLFAASLGGTPVLQVLGAFWFWPLTSILTTYLLCTRSSFGMAFDRMFPAAFGAINDRTHTPVKGSLLNIGVCVIWSLIFLTTFGFLASAANTTFWFAFAYLIFSISAIALPYKRKDIWEKGVHRRILGIPDTTLLGALSAIGMLWLVALSTIGITLTGWNVTLIWMALGVFLYVYYLHKLEKRGINIMQVYGEVPPP